VISIRWKGRRERRTAPVMMRLAVVALSILAGTQACRMKSSPLPRPPKELVPPDSYWGFLDSYSVGIDGPVLAVSRTASAEMPEGGDGAWTYYYPGGGKRADVRFLPDSFDLDIILYREDGSECSRGRLRIIYENISRIFRPIGFWTYVDASGVRYGLDHRVR